LIQIVKEADPEFLRLHLESLHATARQSPQKYQLKLLSYLQAVEPTGRSLDLTAYFDGLRAKENGLRWTAAKALVRACPQSAAQEIGNLLVVQCGREFEREREEGREACAAALHGYLLALGRLIHRGKLKTVTEAFLETLKSCLQFDQVKGSYAVGSFVRDAGCYVCWTAARFLVLSDEGREGLARSLTSLALFDREVSCRRAGAAALQELIGRTTTSSSSAGPSNPNLLHLLEIIHFSSVSTLSTGFHENFQKISQFLPQWKSSFAQHLLQVTLRNFDGKVREAGALALAQCGAETLLPVLVAEYAEKSAEDVFFRHGLLLAMGEIAKTLADQAVSSSSTMTLITLAKDVNKIPLKSLGFDLLLEAYLKLITQLPFDADWLVALQTAFKTKSDSSRLIAVECLQAQASRSSDQVSGFFGACLRGVDAERDVFVQRGCLAALSAIPRGSECPVLAVLVKAAKQTRPVNDIERRCEALRAIKRLLQRNAIDDGVEAVRVALEEAGLLSDYTLDVRGDVGSLVRLEAMSLLAVLNAPLTAALCDCVLEQRWGRIEKLREAARALLPADCDAGAFDGFYRGLVYTAGGLDAQLAEEAVQMLKNGNESLLTGCLRRALTEHNSRLQLTALITIEHLKDSLPQKFLRECTAYLLSEFLTRHRNNIRKLMMAFRLLKGIGAGNAQVEEYLRVQAGVHEYPAIRQLLQE
jgi:hypothetical protein